jgi:hypothetical protein
VANLFGSPVSARIAAVPTPCIDTQNVFLCRESVVTEGNGGVDHRCLVCLSARVRRHRAYAT